MNLYIYEPSVVIFVEARKLHKDVIGMYSDLPVPFPLQPNMFVAWSYHTDTNRPVCNAVRWAESTSCFRIFINLFFVLSLSRFAIGIV